MLRIKGKALFTPLSRGGEIAQGGGISSRYQAYGRFYSQCFDLLGGKRRREKNMSLIVVAHIRTYILYDYELLFNRTKIADLGGW